MYPNIIDEKICKRMRGMNENSQKTRVNINRIKNIKKELWVFFYKIHTCLSLSLLTEIFSNNICVCVNRTNL